MGPESFLDLQGQYMPFKNRILLLSALLWPVCGQATTATLAERICNGYEQVTSVSCMARKSTTVQGHTAQMLSRIYYQRPNRLHVENITPFKRRIMADGERFYLSQENWRKGYSVPLANLDEEWRIMQQAVPGTAMEHLLRLRGIPEEELEPADGLPLRRGYQAPRVYVVLACDAQGRLARIEIFQGEKTGEKTATYLYDDFTEAARDCWLAARQEAEITMGQETLREIRRLDNLQINQPIAPALFDPRTFFKDLEFVDNFPALEQ
ncbi:MAG: hypothetical protein LC725_02020 [Lentisphaerae bacterium]|nr:hypothetical protein [Lentisphaerota bacterium]